MRDLLESVPSNARLPCALVTRLRIALKKPPMPNHYIAPRLRTLDAVAFAARGYCVQWTTPRPSPIEGRADTFLPSCLVYVTVTGTKVELPTILPGEVHRLASWASSARQIGWRFAWWQAKRELSWILQRR